LIIPSDNRLSQLKVFFEKSLCDNWLSLLIIDYHLLIIDYQS